MAKRIKITIENKLVMEKRDMSVYHHSTRSAHMISYNSSVTMPLRSVIEDDYLHISIVTGPGNFFDFSVILYSDVRARLQRELPVDPPHLLTPVKLADGEAVPGDQLPFTQA